MTRGCSESEEPLVSPASLLLQRGEGVVVVVAAAAEMKEEEEGEVRGARGLRRR